MILDPVRLERALLCENAANYRKAKPFPHAVLRDCFDSDLLRRLADQFPPLGSPAWHSSFNERPENKKHASTDLGIFTPELAAAVVEFNTGYFLNWLEKLTGVVGLIPDMYYLGGGLHAIERGGWLNVHTDFNRHKHMRLDRRLNVLVYLNDPWEEEWGGDLVLYGASKVDGLAHPYCPTEPVVKIAPTLGTVVVFDTSPWSFHGHPEPLRCPEGVLRKSIALYYYTNGRPAEETLPDHSTIFFAEET